MKLDKIYSRAIKTLLNNLKIHAMYDDLRECWWISTDGHAIHRIDRDYMLINIDKLNIMDFKMFTLPEEGGKPAECDFTSIKKLGDIKAYEVKASDGTFTRINSMYIDEAYTKTEQKDLHFEINTKGCVYVYYNEVINTIILPIK